MGIGVIMVAFFVLVVFFRKCRGCVLLMLVLL